MPSNVKCRSDGASRQPPSTDPHPPPNPNPSDGYAALDLGTNSILLLLARPTAEGTLTEQAEYCRVTRLGEGVAASRRLKPEAIRRTLDAVTEFMTKVPHGQNHGVGVAAATSAVRDALNREDFLAPCRELTGGAPLLLSGDREAATVFCGAASDQPDGTFCVTIDTGGGSTEIAAGHARTPEPELAFSLDLGCIRLSEQFHLQVPTAAATIAAARRTAAALLAPVIQAIRQRLSAESNIQVLASGGTATTFAAMLRQMTVYDRRRIQGTPATAAALSAWAEQLLQLDAAARARFPGLPADRAEMLPAGFLILSEALRLLSVAQLTVTTRGLRFGLVTQLQHSAIPATWTW